MDPNTKAQAAKALLESALNPTTVEQSRELFRQAKQDAASHGNVGVLLRVCLCWAEAETKRSQFKAAKRIYEDIIGHAVLGKLAASWLSYAGFCAGRGKVRTARKVYEPSSVSRAAENENLSYKKENEGIQLYGLVTETTKTKPGRDFYDFFYQKYQLSQNPENKIIEIDEMISFGRTTRIMVKIENQIIFQFFSRPKLDYLEEMAENALQRVNRYFQDLRKQKQQIMQY